jgi:hypothetical protein
MRDTPFIVFSLEEKCEMGKGESDEKRYPDSRRSNWLQARDLIDMITILKGVGKIPYL